MTAGLDNNSRLRSTRASDNNNNFNNDVDKLSRVLRSARHSCITVIKTPGLVITVRIMFFFFPPTDSSYRYTDGFTRLFEYHDIGLYQIDVKQRTQDIIVTRLSIPSVVCYQCVWYSRLVRSV